MTTSEWDLERDGFRVLRRAVDATMVKRLLSVFDEAFSDDSQSVRARSSRGHVYAARNLIESIPEVTTVWQSDPMLGLLREVLGDDLGLVRALFFDKPPERSWNLPWHKDTSISVKDNSAKSQSFSRPTIKAGVPHVIASDDLLRQMLTLRIHLDEVTDENGPLRVIPRSHVASDSDGIGVDGAVTIHAAPGVRVFVKAIAWANLQASLIFAAFARFSHDHRHNRVPPVRIVGNKAGTGGGENLDNKADSEFQKFSDLNLTNRASHELVSLWHSGSQDAARVLMARYEVRLIALVASRLNRKYRDGIAPEDVVQSAMGSFFRVTRAGASQSIKLESTASAWNILSTFVRRKLARALERETAAKRGGGQTRVSLDDLEPDLRTNPSATEANELLAEIHSLLNSDQSQLLELLLEKATQREIAEQLGVDERTIRRRIKAMQNILNGQLASIDKQNGMLPDSTVETINLPNISYRQFVLGKLVGTGALGKVYRARLQTDGQVVAVKFMHRHLWTDPASRLSFLREIDHASKINHHSVVKYLGWGQSPHGGPYLVCEYVDGQPLTNVKPNDSATSVQWLAQICEAVAAAHQAGVVHGDLTPNNILLDRNGRVVVTDFGFATYSQIPLADSIAFESIASPGGTLGFAAPEQISPAFGTISFATDIYAIGGVAYYLLTICLLVEVLMMITRYSIR